MSLEVKIGPPQLAIHQGHTVLLTELDGQIISGSRKGLYFQDTRLISNWSIFANGEPWDLLSWGALRSFAMQVFLGGGIHEDIDLTNYGLHAVSFNLELAVRSDFADIFEVKGGHVVRRGRVVMTRDGHEQRLKTIYRNQDFRRGISVRVHDGAARAGYANGRICLQSACGRVPIGIAA